MESKFAEQYDKTPDGWIRFPSDTDYRKKYFVHETIGHPARANLYMLEEIVRLVSQPGEQLVDPMAGTGSLIIAALPPLSRRVICIDIEPKYYQLMRASLDYALLEFEERVVLLCGNCLDILPIHCQHIIFSPPYSDIMQRRTIPKADSDKYLAGSYSETIQEYCQTEGNVGRLSKFLYNMKMEQVYQKCSASLTAGGTLTIIIKDYTDKGKRIFLSHWVNTVCYRYGLTLINWFKRYSPGTGYLKLWKSKGLKVVEDEDILVYRKVGAG